jgi:hypothetical protein
MSDDQTTDDQEETGNELSPEQIKELQEKVAEAETVAAKASELEAQLKEKEEQLTKLSKKDFDYGRLRDKTEQQIEDMKKKMSEKEKLLLDEVMSLTNERDEEKQARYNETIEEVLNSLSGGDEELKKSILAAEKDLAGEPQTVKELEDRLRKAFILAKGEAPKRNPIFSGYSSSYREPGEKKERFTDTEAGKASLKAWFPQMANRILKEKPKS